MHKLIHQIVCSSFSSSSRQCRMKILSIFIKFRLSQSSQLIWHHSARKLSTSTTHNENGCWYADKNNWAKVSFWPHLSFAAEKGGGLSERKFFVCLYFDTACRMSSVTVAIHFPPLHSFVNENVFNLDKQNLYGTRSKRIKLYDTFESVKMWLKLGYLLVGTIIPYKNQFNERVELVRMERN